MNINNFFQYLKNKNINLTKSQSKAVEFKNGMLVLLAVPGSGKTTSTLCRNAKLILVDNINPRRICNMTFSKAAAQEMSLKFNSMFSDICSTSPHFSTIHSLAFKIIKDFFSQKNIKYTFIEGNNNFISKNRILKKIYKDLNEEIATEDILDELNLLISFCRNSLYYPKDKIVSKIKTNIFNFPSIYEKYMKIKKEYNYIDYDDILVISLNVLKSNTYIRNKYISMFDYIQIDEAQDMSKVQYEIIKILGSNTKNVCFIGDEDQCIYEWRGANPLILLNVKVEFPTTEIICMEQNFRSSPVIVDKCNNFIKSNEKRYDKNMITQNTHKGNIKVIKSSNEHKQIIDTMSLVKEINSYKDTAILYRNNSSAITFINYLLTHNISFNILGGKDKITNHWIVEDLYNFYLFSKDMHNIKLFKKIYYKMYGLFLSKDLINDLSKKYDNSTDILSFLLDNYDLKSLIKIKIQHNINSFKKINKCKKAVNIFELIAEDLKYREFLDKKGISSYVTFLDIFINISKTVNSIDDFIQRLTQIHSSIVENKFNPNNITLSTMHSSKGLEWKTVIIIDMANNVIPNIEDDNDLESERRLAYVAFTRAKDNLYLLYPLEKGEEKQQPSSFIKEFLPSTKKNLNSKKSIKKDYNVNTKILHESLGKGIIKKRENKSILVKFEEYGFKQLDLNFCVKYHLIEII